MRCGVGGLKSPLRCFERSRRAGPLHCAHVTRARPGGRPLLLYFAPCNGPTRRSGTVRRRLGETPAASRRCERMAQGVEPNAIPNGFGLAWPLYWARSGRTRWQSVHLANRKPKRGQGTVSLSASTTTPVRVCGWSLAANPDPWPRSGSHSSTGPERPQRPVLRCPRCMSCRNAPDNG